MDFFTQQPIYITELALSVDLVEFVKVKFPGENESTVRRAISAKCNDEDKCCTRKAKKRPAIDAALPDLANIDDGDEIDHA